MLDHFSWGSAFFEVNRELLDIYAKCTNAEDIGIQQEAWMEKLEEEYQTRRNGEDVSDDMWTSGNANHNATDFPLESEADSEESELEDDANLWTTDRLGNQVRKTESG